MVTHFKVSGHLACGHKGNNLTSTRELNRVKCRSCKNTDAYKEARKTERNAARRAARKAKATRTAIDWRQSWIERLTAMPGPQRLPRGFAGQSFV
jgi:ATPase subunit of ABC transporter with duplicated ATPase domains